MQLFIDTFVNKIDRKGRVSVPAPYRSVLAQQNFAGIVVFPSFKSASLHCAGMAWMESLSANMTQVDLFSDEYDDLTATLFADSKQLPFDGEGRVLLPESFLNHANLTQQAAFVGRGHVFEIWEPDALEAHKAAARQRALAQRRTVKLRFDGGPDVSPGGRSGGAQ